MQVLINLLDSKLAILIDFLDSMLSFVDLKTSPIVVGESKSRQARLEAVTS
jgi:hypothetical protein